ncbi:MAG: transporter, partial [Bacteroidales bacterium]|nr:transporter [Bacteroidales bacterium]
MLTGIVAYPLISYLSFVTPYLIFGMLFLTFCKLSPRAIRFHPAHIYLLIIQLIGSVGVYFLLRSCHQAVAHGAMVCMLVPTATAAAVVTGMLGGSMAFITSYILLCNIAVAFAAPAIFPWIGMQSEMAFIDSFLYICRQVGPLLLCPLLLAWTIRYFFPSAGKRLARMHGFSFYC